MELLSYSKITASEIKLIILSRETDKTVKLSNYEDCKSLHESLDTLVSNLNDKIQ